MDMLRKYWQSWFSFNKTLGISLILLLGIPRFIIVLHANQTGNYNLIPAIFILMILLPFILLTKKGRQQTGMRSPASIKWLLYSFVLGIVFCVIIFLLSYWLFGLTIRNPFEYISRSYPVSKVGVASSDKLIFFIIYAIIGMTFSPFGEELFYRGLVHNSLAADYGQKKASILDSAAFALTHLAHFGIVYNVGRWEFLFLPGIIWVISIFLAGRLFFYCRVKTGSIFGAIIAHAGFNLAMMYLIFYHIF